MIGGGAPHAVAPGHGKSITAAYLLGTRGRYRDALRLGVIVAAMHTCSVLVLALVWVRLSGAAGGGTRDLTAWLQVVAGLVVIGVGAHLTWRHLRGRRHGHAHPHRSARAPGHGHPHDHQHHDTPAPADPWSRRGLTALAVSGGLLSSPSAFLVLVSGLLTGRAVDALVLVLAFGLGMAVTLTGVGVVTIRGFALVAAPSRRGRGADPAVGCGGCPPVSRRLPAGSTPP